MLPPGVGGPGALAESEGEVAALQAEIATLRRAGQPGGPDSRAGR